MHGLLPDAAPGGAPAPAGLAPLCALLTAPQTCSSPLLKPATVSGVLTIMRQVNGIAGAGDLWAVQ